MRFLRSRFFRKFFFVFIFISLLIYLILYTINVSQNDSSVFKISKANIKCITQICVSYVGITECLDITEPYIFKVDFNENFTTDKSNVTYSVQFQSLGKKCAE